MKNLYDVNGLVFWSEREIRLRKQFAEHYAATLKDVLLTENTAWRFFEVESPLLTPASLINQNYTEEDVWFQTNNTAELVLRPETTPGSYAYARHLLESQKGLKLPLVVWQTGKSFRREQDQVTKNMRLKEFYQQEFQCLYATDTLNDYHAKILEPVRQMISETVGLPTRIVPSDRLPSYSQITSDIEVDNGDKWMEVCSISRRTDFPIKWEFVNKGKEISKDILVLEVAIGLDRCVYNYETKNRQ